MIWDALKAACEADLQTARVILDSAGVVVASDDMSVCYDERGASLLQPLRLLFTKQSVYLIQCLWKLAHTGGRFTKMGM